ncbi:MAG: hypothetical protein AAGM45_00765 [Cyanobacteria bacterium J06588_5]
MSEPAADAFPSDSASDQATVPDTTASTPPSPEDVASVIAELEQYRARLVEDFTNTAKKAKLPKSMTMAQLKEHPEILKIDMALAQLRGETPPDDAA